MIQRIQTVYLLLATAFMAFLLGPAIATLIGEQQQIFEINMSGIYRVGEEGKELMERTLPLMALLLIIPLLNFVVLFLFRKRKLQMRLTMFNLILMVGAMILIGYYLIYARNTFSAKIYFSYRMVFPVLSAILNYLAYRGILRDEILIKSYDRLR